MDVSELSVFQVLLARSMVATLDQGTRRAILDGMRAELADPEWQVEIGRDRLPHAEAMIARFRLAIELVEKRQG